MADEGSRRTLRPEAVALSVGTNDKILGRRPTPFPVSYMSEERASSEALEIGSYSARGALRKWRIAPHQGKSRVAGPRVPSQRLMGGCSLVITAAMAVQLTSGCGGRPWPTAGVLAPSGAGIG